MRLALATCAALPPWEVDDRPFHRALERRGVEVRQAVWDDPGADWGSFDACLVRTTWDYMERRDEYVAWAERVAASTPFWNPPGVVRWNTEKTYLADLAAQGIPIAPTRWLARGARVEVARLVREFGWRRGFLKPWVGATARETLRFDADAAGLAAAQAHVDRLLPREGLILQPYLDRVESEGERSAIFLDNVLSHAVRKVPAPGDYRVQDDFGARDEPYRLTPAERDLAERTVALVAEPGLWPAHRPGERLLYARVDLLLDETGRAVVSELELVEPSLFFRHAPSAADLLADGLLRRLASRSGR